MDDKWITQYTHWQAQVLKAYYHERGFGMHSSRNHSHVTNHDVDINHLCTQPSQSQQSLTNLHCLIINRMATRRTRFDNSIHIT